MVANDNEQSPYERVFMQFPLLAQSMFSKSSFSDILDFETRPIKRMDLRIWCSVCRYASLVKISASVAIELLSTSALRYSHVFQLTFQAIHYLVPKHCVHNLLITLVTCLIVVSVLRV